MMSEIKYSTSKNSQRRSSSILDLIPFEPIASRAVSRMLSLLDIVNTSGKGIFIDDARGLPLM